MRADPRMQRDAPAATPCASISGADLAFELCLRQRLDHEIAFPGAVALGFPVLDRAAAADAEMRTERRDPLGAGALDRKQAPAVGMARAPAATSTVSPPSV